MSSIDWHIYTDITGSIFESLFLNVSLDETGRSVELRSNGSSKENTVNNKCYSEMNCCLNLCD